MNIDWSQMITAEAAAAAALQEWRGRAHLSRLDFALRLSKMGIITDAEAAAWLAAGVLPKVAINALDLIADPAARQEARLRFIAAVEIARHNPFMGLLASTAGVTDAQLDEMFLPE